MSCSVPCGARVGSLWGPSAVSIGSPGDGTGSGGPGLILTLKVGRFGFMSPLPLGRRIQERKISVTVLLRSQSNFIPPLLASGQAAYGVTKGGSISAADGASRGGSRWNKLSYVL